MRFISIPRTVFRVSGSASKVSLRTSQLSILTQSFAIWFLINTKRGFKQPERSGISEAFPRM